MKNRHWLWLFALLFLLTTAFLWGNSLKSIPESDAQSVVVADTLRPVLNPDQRIDALMYHTYVRKLAHFLIYGFLGLVAGGFATCLGVERNTRFYSLPLLMTLLVAVVDEWIQHFALRGSQVTDVVLDFAGSLVGLLVAAVIYRIVLKLKRNEDTP